MTASPHANWSSGDNYEPYVGRWSRLLARDFVRWLARPAGLHWLDVGAGTGAVSTAILELAEPAEVLAIDPSAGFLGYAKHHLPDERFQIQIGSADALPVGDAQFETVVGGLMLNFIPDPARALSEMTRATRSGGVVATYVWDYRDGQDMMRYFWDAAVMLDPAVRASAEQRRFVPLCQPDALAQLFVDTGLRQVENRSLDLTMHFRDFDDYWNPFLGGQGPAPSYAATLSPDRLATLRESIRESIPTAPDGSISLPARAFAVRGVK